MALRVLLADESSTIKRVIQLALQDYAVDVKSVPVGLDVMSVTKTFKPDVIFADILLPKRSGYEICSDLKADANTKSIPVILMWSGFMDLDEKKATQCQADGRLEKPFETDQLRQLVQSLVPQLRTNPISAFLKFPRLPEFTENQSKPTLVLPAEEISLPPESKSGPINIDALPEVSEDDDFQQVPLHKGGILDNIPEENIFKVDVPQHEDVDQQWAKQDIGQFKLNLPEEQQVQPPAIEEFNPTLNEDSRNEHNLKLNPSGSFEEFVYESAKPTSPVQMPTALDFALTEKILREEAQKMLENMLWKILPEIAERVVKEEINKLIQETEKSI